MSFFGPSNVTTRGGGGKDNKSGFAKKKPKKKKKSKGRNADGATNTPTTTTTTTITTTPRTINPIQENRILAEQRRTQLQNDEDPTAVDEQQAYNEYRRRYFEKLGVEDGRYTNAQLLNMKITPPKTYDEWSRATRGERRASFSRATIGKKTLKNVRAGRSLALKREARTYWNEKITGDTVEFQQWYDDMKVWLDEHPDIKEAGIEADSWEATFDAYENRNNDNFDDNDDDDDFGVGPTQQQQQRQQNQPDGGGGGGGDDDDFGNAQNLPLPNYIPVPTRRDTSGNIIERPTIEVDGTMKRPIRVSELLNSGGLSSRILQWLYCDNVRRLRLAGGNAKRPRAFFTSKILRDMTELWKLYFIPYNKSFEIQNEDGGSRFPNLLALMNVEEDTYQYRSRPAYGWSDTQMVQVLLDDRRDIVDIRQNDGRYLNPPNPDLPPGKNLIHSAKLMRDDGELHLLKGRPIVGAADAVSDEYVIINKINFGNQIFDPDADNRQTFKLPFKHVVEAIFMMKLYGKRKALITSTYDDHFWLSALQVMLTSNLQQNDRVYGPWFNIEKDSMRSILDRPLKKLKKLLNEQYFTKYGVEKETQLPGRPSEEGSVRYKYRRDKRNLIDMYDAFLIQNFGQVEIQGWNRLERILSPNVMNAFENAFTVRRLQLFIENYNREVAEGWADEEVDDFNIIGIPQIPLTWAEKGIKNLFTKRYTDIRGGWITEANTRLSQEELFTVEWDHGSIQRYNRRQLIKLQRQAASFVVNRVGFRNVDELMIGDETLAEALKTGRAINIENIKRNIRPVRHEVCMEVDLTGDFEQAWEFIDRWITDIEATGETGVDIEEPLECLRRKERNDRGEWEEVDNLITESRNMRRDLETFMNGKVRNRNHYQFFMDWWVRIPREDGEGNNNNNAPTNTTTTTPNNGMTMAPTSTTTTTTNDTTPLTQPNPQVRQNRRSLGIVREEYREVKKEYDTLLEKMKSSNELVSSPSANDDNEKLNTLYDRKDALEKELTRIIEVDTSTDGDVQGRLQAYRDRLNTDDEIEEFILEIRIRYLETFLSSQTSGSASSNVSYKKSVFNLKF